MYLLPSSGQKWIHISILPVFELYVYVLGETRDTSSHPHTQLYTFPLKRYTFPLKRYINNKTSLFINVHLDLEQENVHNRKSLKSLESHPYNFKSAIIKSLAEWILDLTPSSAAVRGWFGLYHRGTWTTCRYWKAWNRCFVSYKKWYIPQKLT